MSREVAGVQAAGRGVAGAASVRATERKVLSRAAAECVNLVRRVQRGVREGERVKMLALSSRSETSGDGNVAEGDALEAGGGHRVAEGLGGKDELWEASGREDIEPKN